MSVNSTRLLMYCMVMLSVSSASVLNAQSDTTINWKHGGNLGVNFSQVGLSNWTGGGQNAISIAGLTNFFANYEESNLIWGNSLELGYGLTKLGKDEFRKSDDRIILVSKFGYKATEQLSYSALLDFRTQFTEGFKYESGNAPLLISNIMAPGFLNIGVGLNYRPMENFDITLSPLSNRVVFVLDDSLSRLGAFGVDPGKNIRSELGATSTIFFKRDLVENITLQTRLNVFAPYSSITEMIVNWETLLTLKVNNYINASLATDLLYDPKITINRDDGTIGPIAQFRNVLAIGFGYKF